MVAYILRRLLISVLVLWAVLSLAFIGFRVVPGDAAQQLIAERSLNPDSAGTQSPGELRLLRRQLGLDKPIIVQYGAFMTHAIRLDFGRSISSHQPVFDEIWLRFPYTLAVAISALILTLVFGVTAGILAAVHNRGVLGTVVVAGATLGVSVPNFWLGTMLALIFGVKLHILPVAGTGDVRHLILPAITVATLLSGILTRLMRASLLDTLTMDYIVTARAKGLRRRAVIYHHALKNAFIPIVTVLGLMTAGLLNGIIVVENVFSWPGLGTLTLDAISSRDYPVIEGTTFFFASIIIAANLLVDVSYRLLDPRIKYS